MEEEAGKGAQHLLFVFSHIKIARKLKNHYFVGYEIEVLPPHQIMYGE